MDERTLIRRAGSDVPKRDPEAQERARAILRAEMGTDLAAASGRRFGRPVVAWLGAAAASIAVVLVLVQAFRPERRDVPLATGLERLVAVASSDVPLNLTGDRYLYTSMESLHDSSHDFSSSDGVFTYRLLIRETIETWRREDGSGRRETSISHVRFASAEDRDAWVAAGRPELQKAGDVERGRFLVGDFFPDLSGLPTDPDELKSVLETGVPLDQSPGDDNLALAIGELFEQQDALLDIRAALFEILGGLSSVRSIGPVTDPLGRDGIGFAVLEGNGGERWFLFELDTGAFLAAETVQPGETEPSSWEALTTTAIVESRTERPSPA